MKTASSQLTGKNNKKKLISEIARKARSEASRQNLRKRFFDGAKKLVSSPARVNLFFRLFNRLDRYNLNANYQYCTNVADDAAYCQWLQKDSEGNSISYKTARDNGTYTKEWLENTKLLFLTLFGKNDQIVVS